MCGVWSTPCAVCAFARAGGGYETTVLAAEAHALCSAVLLCTLLQAKPHAGVPACVGICGCSRVTLQQKGISEGVQTCIVGACCLHGADDKGIEYAESCIMVVSFLTHNKLKSQDLSRCRTTHRGPNRHSVFYLCGALSVGSGNSVRARVCPN